MFPRYWCQNLLTVWTLAQQSPVSIGFIVPLCTTFCYDHSFMISCDHKRVIVLKENDQVFATISRHSVAFSKLLSSATTYGVPRGDYNLSPVVLDLFYVYIRTPQNCIRLRRYNTGHIQTTISLNFLLSKIYQIICTVWT